MNTRNLLEYGRPEKRKWSTRERILWILMACSFALLLFVVFVPWKIGGFDRTGAMNAAARADLNTLQQAVDQFSVDVGRYPTTAEGFSVLISAPPNCDGWHGPYLSKLPKDPWGSPYTYRQVVRDGKPAIEVRTFAGGAMERSAAELSNSSTR